MQNNKRGYTVEVGRAQPQVDVRRAGKRCVSMVTPVYFCGVLSPGIFTVHQRVDRSERILFVSGSLCLWPKLI